MDLQVAPRSWRIPLLGRVAEDDLPAWLFRRDVSTANTNANSAIRDGKARAGSAARLGRLAAVLAPRSWRIPLLGRVAEDDLPAWLIARLSDGRVQVSSATRPSSGIRQLRGATWRSISGL
jgi:hypothetical protein